MAGIEIATGELTRQLRQQSGRKNLTSTDNGHEHTINLNGTFGYVSSVRNAGQQITVGGWNNKHWNYKEGQRVLLIQRDGSETRYMIDKVEHCGDPNDQYFIECSFCPRHECQAIQL